MKHLYQIFGLLMIFCAACGGGSNTDQTPAAGEALVPAPTPAPAPAPTQAPAPDSTPTSTPDSTPTPDPTTALRTVSFAASVTPTPWASGTLDFLVNPPLSGGETMDCRTDVDTAASCASVAGRASLAYGPLAAGLHTLSVTISGFAGSRSYVLPWQIIAAPDIVVVGGTPAGIVAAVSAARAGRSVVLMESSPWLGGMMSGGLSKTDVGGNGHSYIGGVSREVFDRMRARELASGNCRSLAECYSYFDFEPRVAKETFEAMLGELPDIAVQRKLAMTGVVKKGTRIIAIDTPRGRIPAKLFIDASYEGDLTTMAGVATTMEREARRTDLGGEFLEDDAGVGLFKLPYSLVIDPYRIPGDPGSGLISFVQAAPSPLPKVGTADRLLMSYNYRVCVTDDPGNRVPFSKPANYDPAVYEGSARVAVAMQASGRQPLDEMYFNPTRTVLSTTAGYFKHDLNGGAAFSIDMTAPALNQVYPEANAVLRVQIANQYRNYIQGLLYFWQTDPRFGALNAKVARHGLCKDEFVDNGNWPYSLYTRETRRMIGEYVVNQNDVVLNGRRPVFTDSIGMGAYSMDSHIRQIVVINRSAGGAPARDMVGYEGGRSIRLPTRQPYPVPYRSLTPQRAQATNLLNPVTLSSTSMAYSSLRMEPTFMILGHAAGTAAALAVEASVAVQDVDVSALQSRLEAAGQVIRNPVNVP